MHDLENGNKQNWTIFCLKEKLAMSVQYELSTTLTTLVPRDNRMKREIEKYSPSEETSETSAREMNFWPLGALAPPETSSGWEVDIWTR